MCWPGRLIRWVLRCFEAFNHADGPHQKRRRLTREEIEELIEANGGPVGLDLTGCDLSKLDLRGMELRRVRLVDCDFYLANLRGSILALCDLRRANIHDACLDYVDLYHADLEGAELVGASLVKANLNRANLLNTRLPDGIKEAIGGSLLQENKAEYERYLAEVSRFVPESSIARRRAMRFIEAGHIYRALKNNLMSAGRYEEASWAYVQERRMRRKAFAPWRVMEVYDALKSQGVAQVGSKFAFWIRSFARWIGDWLAELSCGYGERPLRTLGWSVVIIILSALVYKWTGGVVCVGRQMTWLDYLNYSLGAFTTMGYSQFEAVTPLTQTLTSIEALVGSYASSGKAKALMRRKLGFPSKRLM